MKTIRKAGALIFKDGKMLIVKAHGKPFWVSPGGKYEGEETAEQCLARELLEELGVGLASLKHYKTYNFDKAAYTDAKLVLELYFVQIAGEPKPSREIELLHWFSKNDNLPLAPSFGEKILADLISDNILTA